MNSMIRVPLTAPPLITLLKQFAIKGHLHGLAQASLCVQLQLRPLGDDLAIHFTARVEEALGGRLAPMPADREASLAGHLTKAAQLPAFQQEVWPVVQVVNQLLVRLQEGAGLPVAGGLRCQTVVARQAQAPLLDVLLFIPGLSPGANSLALVWSLEQLNALASGKAMPLEGLEALLAQLERHAPSGSNNLLLLKAAYRYGVPVTDLLGGGFQYGWGACSRWMDSTFTDATSTISAKFARNKAAANALLQRAGLPVPEQVVVPSLEHAISAAARIGYPVVIKPVDLDGGTGVSAGLEDEAALRSGYERAAAHSKKLILEKHIEGNDHRLGIVHGQLAWATLRAPAGVWGDGILSISQLMEIANQDPRRSTKRWSNMRPLTMNVEALELLQSQGVALASVPEPGRFIRFRRAANISSGGTPTNVMGKMHPDNVALAVRAAKVFRLDFAGIDLITPDITRSWLEAGGAICEVNGQPQFSVVGPQAPLLAIQGLFQGDGRIPVVVILTDLAVDGLLGSAAQQWHETGHTLGYSTEHGLLIGGERVKSGRSSAFEDAQALLLNPQVHAVAVATNGKEWLYDGLPFDRFDLLLVGADANPRVLQSLMPLCRGEVWELDANQSVAPHALAGKLTAWLSQCDERHRLNRLQ